MSSVPLSVVSRVAVLPASIVGLVIWTSACPSQRAEGVAATVASSAASTMPTPSSAASASAQTANPAKLKFSLLYEGTCSASKVFAVGTTAVHVLPQAAAAFDASGMRVLYRNKPWALQTGGPQTSFLARIGGVDEAHAWLEQRAPTSSGTTTAVPIFAARKWSGGPPLSKGEFSFYLLENFIEQADGSLWAFGTHNEYLVPGEPERKTFAWSKDGALLSKNLPGADMSAGILLRSGEVVAAARGKGNKAVLRRWSPKSAVDDLVIKDAPASSLAPTVRTAEAYTVVAVPAATKAALSFYRYAEGAVTPCALNAHTASTSSWTLTALGDLYVATQAGELWIETHDGKVVQEKLPDAGELETQTREPWFKATSGALYQRSASGWNTMTLPAATAGGARQVEWVRDIGGEVLIGTVFLGQAGGGTQAKRPRAVYTSKSVGASFQCTSDAFVEGKKP